MPVGRVQIGMECDLERGATYKDQKKKKKMLVVLRHLNVVCVKVRVCDVKRFTRSTLCLELFVKVRAETRLHCLQVTR